MEHESLYRHIKGWNNFSKIKKTEVSFFNHVFHTLTNLTPNVSTILDIGFGNGQLLQYARSKNIRCIGIEIDNHSIRLAKENGYEVYDIENFSSTLKFDAIFLLDVLEHNDSMECVELLRFCRSHLAADGLIVLKVPNGDSPFGLRNQNGDPTHKNFCGVGKLHAYAQSSQLMIVKIFAEPEPILCGSIKHLIHRVVFSPIKFVINLIVNIIFFPGNWTEFTSQNIMAILRDDQ